MGTASEMNRSQEELSSITLILSATYHRNKNQHRLAKWWKSFSVLRRNISKLTTELEKYIRDQKLVGDQNKYTIASREAVESRVDFVVRWVVPKCYLAFSAVVADNQFSNLGLMLVGMLARIRKIILPLGTGQEEEDKDEDVEKQATEADTSGLHKIDFGEVIRREDIEKANVRTYGVDDSEAEEERGAVRTSPAKKRAKGLDGPKDISIGVESEALQRRKKREKDKNLPIKS